MSRSVDGPAAIRGSKIDRSNPLRQLQIGILLLSSILVIGTVGYMLFGLRFLDALYLCVTVISTVGFRELGVVTDGFQVFTIVLILSGVGTALYTLGVMLEALVEGRLTDSFGRRRMQRQINDLQGHVIVCGFGRVGRSIARRITAEGGDVVVIDTDSERLEGWPGLWVEGNATDDQTLQAAGIDRARSLVAALTSDADNLYVTLTGRSLSPRLFIAARARVESAEPKLTQAGADRVVNPQNIGGERMAALVMQPAVADFLDVVMHDGSLEFRLAEVTIAHTSPLAGLSLRDAHVRDRTGAMILAMRDEEGNFRTNPPPEEVIDPGEVLIAIGTNAQLESLREAASEISR